MHASRALNDELTDAETDVLRLLAAGLSYRDIAGIRRCNWRTVQTHALTIYAKLGVHCQRDAALLAFRRNIISIDDAWQILQMHKRGERWRTRSAF